jgi:hypothetical protein
MPYMGGWAVCVPDLPGLDWLAIELVADVDAADRPLSDVSANQHVDSTQRPRGGELLIIDGLELRQSRTPLSRAHRAPAARPGPAAGTDLDPQRHRRRVHRRRAPAIQPGGVRRARRGGPRLRRRGANGPGARRAEIWTVSGGAAYAGKPRPLRLAIAAAFCRQFANHVGLSPTACRAHVRAPGHRSPRVILAGFPGRGRSRERSEGC